jgi:hypothetical protein
MIHIMKNIWHGRYGLAFTFWLLWFLPAVLFGLILMPVIYPLVYLGRAMGTDLALKVTYTYFLLVFLYNLLMYISVSKSAARYQGQRIWPAMANIIVIASLILNISFIAYIGMTEKIDYGRYIGNIKSLITPDPDYPFIGFWKEDCGDNFGLSIEKAGNGMYSVSLCGPGGCFKPDIFRPNTSIENDPDYRIIDENTIEIKTGDGFKPFQRC